MGQWAWVLGFQLGPILQKKVTRHVVILVWKEASFFLFICAAYCGSILQEVPLSIPMHQAVPCANIKFIQVTPKLKRKRNKQAIIETLLADHTIVVTEIISNFVLPLIRTVYILKSGMLACHHFDESELKDIFQQAEWVLRFFSKYSIKWFGCWKNLLGWWKSDRFTRVCWFSFFSSLPESSLMVSRSTFAISSSQSNVK